MKKLSKLLLATCAATLLSTGAHAVTLSSSGGPVSGIFGWTDGLGPIDRINFLPDTEWVLSVTSPTNVTFSATDGFVPGDEFGLVLDGVATPFTSVTTTTGGYFSGTYASLFGPGSYSFSLNVTALANDLPEGDAYYNFEFQSAAVPVPASLPLLLAGLAGMVALRRRASRA